MRGTRIEGELEIYATNLANKAKCMGTNIKKWKNLWRYVVSTASTIVKSEAVLYHAVNIVQCSGSLISSDHLLYVLLHWRRRSDW
jgi:hypothetical protein